MARSWWASNPVGWILVLSLISRTLVQALFLPLYSKRGPGSRENNLSFATHFYCTPDKGGWVWSGGHKRGKGRRRGKAHSGFILQISQPPPTHLYGLETWLNRSISPQRAVNHTLSNAERWLQAPSAFIINHWDRKDMSLHLQNHWSSDCGHILPENDFPASSTAHGASGAKPRGAIPWGSIRKFWESFLYMILTPGPS